jgi:hypothetical protein
MFKMSTLFSIHNRFIFCSKQDLTARRAISDERIATFNGGRVFADTALGLARDVGCPPRFGR